MGIPLRVLNIEDSEDDTELFIRYLRQGGYDPVYDRVDTPEAMSAALSKHPWDIIIADYAMPRFNAFEALKLLEKTGIDLPFIILSGSIGEDIAVKAMKAGAHDYIMKNNLKRLIPAIEREMREAQIRRARKEAEDQIHYMAYYNPMTGLPNRTLLMKRLEETLVAGKRDKKPVALLLMNLDRFREINETLGRQRGDILLKEVGSRLQDTVFPRDVVAHLGGDEFSVILPLEKAQHSHLAADKIAKALEEPFVIDRIPIVMETSIGIALYPDHAENTQSLMQRSDIAMYEAKRMKTFFTIYNSSLDKHDPQKLTLLGELRHALEHDELVLYYQPKISFKTNSIIGVEALVRWKHPQRGVIPPYEFIGLAERTGLIKPLTMWVFDTGKRQLEILHQRGADLSVSINLSARNLQDSELPGQIAKILKTNGVPPNLLELEITETAIMIEPARAMETLNHLKTMGLRFSIDDFGTGYSSLGYLKKLPVNAIKIDRSFIKDMVVDEDDTAIVRSTIDLAHNLGLAVIAEGVETKAVYDKLAAMGCDEAQGYYMCKPLPTDELEHWLAESSWGLGRK
jgi:diguanylate cyclase